jgi:hypothetical protein
MSKKNKTGRGKAMTLAEFAGPSEGNLDWAQDEFAPTPPAGPAEAGQEVPGMDGDGKKRGTDWRNFGFKAGAMTGNFREEAPVQNTKIVPEDMQAPFVAFVGNLPHNIAADLVSESFDDVIDSRVIKHGNSTFSYVEFETRTALQNAILLTGKIIGGRKIRVDVASDQQRNRLEQERNGGSNNASGRESAMIGRDAMGSAQPNMSPGPGGRGGSRMGSRNASAMDLNREFTRDSMGAAQPTTGAETPTTGGGGDFSREAFGESKPRTPNSGGRAFGGNFRDRQSKPASPCPRAARASARRRTSPRGASRRRWRSRRAPPATARRPSRGARAPRWPQGRRRRRGEGHDGGAAAEEGHSRRRSRRPPSRSATGATRPRRSSRRSRRGASRRPPRSSSRPPRPAPLGVTRLLATAQRATRPRRRQRRRSSPPPRRPRRRLSRRRPRRVPRRRPPKAAVRGVKTLRQSRPSRP